MRSRRALSNSLSERLARRRFFAFYASSAYPSSASSYQFNSYPHNTERMEIEADW